MKEKTVYSIILILVIAGLLFWSAPLFLFAPEEKPNDLTNNMAKDKKILMVVAFNDFKDEEYFVPKEVFEKAGFIVETASSQKGVAQGVDGGEAIIDIKSEEIQAAEYEAIVFCGGPGMIEELDNEIFQKLAKDFNRENKLVAAICVAPALLAKSGLLEGKKATVWSSTLDRSFVKMLEESGAVYKDSAVVVDGKIITASGPAAAQDFGKAIVNLLSF
jgi:protease I